MFLTLSLYSGKSFVAAPAPEGVEEEEFIDQVPDLSSASPAQNQPALPTGTCKTPSPGGPIPIPYPNIAMSTDTDQGSKKVTADGNSVMVKGSVFSKSTGDEAGTAGGGVVSNTTKGKAEFQLYSFDVKFEGKNVCRLTDIMVLNKLSSPNTPPFPEVQPPSIVIPSVLDEDKEAAADIGMFDCSE